MKKITCAIGTDHRGFALKEYIITIAQLAGYAITWHDVGACNNDRSDYPLFAVPVCRLIQQGKVDAGILLCGTGVGMAIAANRCAKIYAALVWNSAVAQAAKEDDNANVLVIAADYCTNEEAQAMITAWLGAEFKRGRYAQRIAMIDAITPQ